MLARTGGNEVYALLAERIPTVPPSSSTSGCSLITSFILRAVADRSGPSNGAQRRPPRHVLDDEAFVENLVAMVAAAVSAAGRA